MAYESSASLKQKFSMSYLMAAKYCPKHMMGMAKGITLENSALGRNI